jgi:hypothetical protein
MTPKPDQCHTPGPWTIKEYGDDDAPALVIHKDTETRVCFMATPGSHGDPAKIEADARLIVAAPDMLAVLIEIIRLATSQDVSDEEWDATIDRGCKIIAAINVRAADEQA